MKKHHLKNKALFLFIVLLAFVDGMLVMGHLQEETPVSTASQLKVLSNALSTKTSGETGAQTVPAGKSVPFTVQAPIGYWTEKPWADYAEEACVYMAYKWGTDSEMPGQYDTAANLKAVGQWETDHLGTSALTDIPQTLQMLNQALGYTKATLSTQITESGLKALLDKGNILIIPVNGQVLDNPYYGDPAPEHHMIVVYDYNADGFLTNDPGTRRGEGFLYPATKILESLQDLNGERQMIVVTR